LPAPGVLENLEYNKFIFLVLEVSLNLTKSENLTEKILLYGKPRLRIKNINSIPVKNNISLAAGTIK